MAIARSGFRITVGTKVALVTLPDVYGAAATTLGMTRVEGDAPAGATHYPSIRSAVEAGIIARVHYRVKNGVERAKLLRGFAPTDSIANGKLSDVIGKAFSRQTYLATGAISEVAAGTCVSAKVATRSKVIYG